MLWREDVRKDLLDADFVSLKIDAVGIDVWRHVNRPRKDLRLDAILDGVERFARDSKRFS